MTASPSESLVALLVQLRLATSGQVQSIAPQVARLARDLPGFDCVWLDALTRAKLVTPFQGAEILAGRGPRLAVGPYVLGGRLPGPSYGRSFVAALRGTRDPARMLLLEPADRDLDAIAADAARLVERSRLASHPALRVARAAGVDAERFWVACEFDRGQIMARWMVENGRFPPTVVLGMARQIAAAMAELEQLELVHGDLSAWGATIDSDARVGLILPGVRPIVRPTEGYASTDLQPEAFDTLAPERIETGAAASMSTDIYGCGCLLWHLAVGRPPFAGGSTITKLKAVHRAKAPDIEQLTVDAPPRLLAAIRACMSVDPVARPPNFAAVVEMLGTPARGAAAVERQLLTSNLGPQRLWGPAKQAPSTLGRIAQGAAVAACLLALLFAPAVWRHRRDFAWRLAGEPTSPAATAAGGTTLAPAEQKLSPGSDRSKIAAGADPKARGESVDRRASGVASERHPPHDATPGSEDSQRDRAARPERGDAPRDDQVATAAYHPRSPSVEPRLLATDRPQRLAELELRHGQTVRGAGASRPVVVVAAAGLRVRGEAICFENVDFVWEDEGEAAGRAIVWLESQQAEFRGCSFHDPRRAGDRAGGRPSAIAWGGAGAGALPGQLRLDHCVFWSVDAAVECRGARSLEIEARESLHTLSGPMVRLAQSPRRNQTVLLELANVTLRSAEAAIEFPGPKLEAGPASLGRVAIEAVDCVFDPRGAGALVLVDHATEPERLGEHVEWTGHGSLATPRAPIVAWRTGPGATPHELNEEGLPVAGLVRSQVEFAGSETSGPNAARLRRWQAPLRSSEPPGIGAGRLTMPGF